MVQPLISLTVAITAALTRERETGRFQCVLERLTLPSRYVVVDEEWLVADPTRDLDAIVWATGFADSDGLDPSLLA